MTDQHREKIKGEKALAIAKAIPRKVIYLQKGITGSVLSDDRPLYFSHNKRKHNIDHSEVMKMLNDGSTPSEVARKFRITKQMVSYIKLKKQP